MELKCINCGHQRDNYETDEQDWYHCPECNKGRFIVIDDSGDFLLVLTLGIFFVATVAMGMYVVLG